MDLTMDQLYPTIDLVVDLAMDLTMDSVMDLHVNPSRMDLCF
jgi:hypothetical protein